MTVPLLQLPRLLAVDANGTPLLGAKLYVYAAQTNNPVVVWRDAALTQPHSVPILANTDGTFPPIYINPGTGDIKINLTTATDFQVADYPIDNIPVRLPLDAVQIGPLDIVNFLGADPIVRQTSAETAAGVTPTNYAYTVGRPIIEVQRYGAVLDGATDDSQALKSALLVASIVGGLVHIPTSTNGMAVASAQLPITVYSNSGLIGDGMDCSKITVTGSGTGHLFKGTNVKGFYAAGLNLVGDGQGTTIDQAAAFNFQADGSASATTGDISIERCRFSNFTAYYWVWFRNSGTTFNMDNIWVRGCAFQSVNGNTIGPSSIGPSSYCVSVEGLSNYSGSGGIGLIRNVWVENNWADCNYNKGFGVAWESTQNVYFMHNVVQNTGQTNSNDAANYAFLVYNNGGVNQSPDPDNIFIEGNIVTAPRDAGIYSAFHGIGSGRIYIRGNLFTGQNSTVNSTLPKAAIALNGTLTAVVQDNVIDACFGGIVVIGQYATQTTKIRGNRVTNCTNQNIQFQSTLTGSVARVEITDNYSSTNQTSVKAIFADVTSAAGIANLTIERNYVSSVFEPIEVSSRSGTALLGYVSISYNECNGQAATAAGLVANALSNAATRTKIVGNRFTGTWGNINILNISTSTGLTVKDNEWNDVSSGACIASNAARGRLEGNRFNNVASANVILVSGGEDLGRSTPTWTGNDNDFIENLQPIEAGSGGSKYVLKGWSWSTAAVAWLQNRVLTGN